MSLIETLVGMKVPYSMEWDATNYIQAGEAHYRDTSCEGSTSSVEKDPIQSIESDYIKLSNVIKTFSAAKEQGNDKLHETVNFMIRDHLPSSWLTQLMHERRYEFEVKNLY